MERIISTIHLTQTTFRLARLASVFLVSTLAGWFASAVVAMQATPEASKVAWYESPQFTAGLVSAVVILAVEFIKQRRETQKEQKQAENEKNKQHLSLTDKKEELSYQERQKLLDERKALEGDRVAFWRERYGLKEFEAVEARIRAHTITNENGRLHNHIHKCHKVIADANGEIPAFEFKYSAAIEREIQEELEKYKKQSLERIEKSIAPDKEA